jgi:hypothetical protein
VRPAPVVEVDVGCDEAQAFQGAPYNAMDIPVSDDPSGGAWPAKSRPRRHRLGDLRPIYKGR